MRCPSNVGIWWLLITALLATGCTGQPSSTSSWQSSSDRALGEAISGLGTARIAVEQEVDERIQHNFAVVTVTDVIDSSAKEISSYLVGQPPDGLHRANRTVTEALQSAVSLLVEVRVELASPGVDRSAANRLVARIDALRKELDELDKTVMQSPGSVGAR